MGAHLDKNQTLHRVKKYDTYTPRNGAGHRINNPVCDNRSIINDSRKISHSDTAEHKVGTNEQSVAVSKESRAQAPSRPYADIHRSTKADPVAKIIRRSSIATQEVGSALLTSGIEGTKPKKIALTAIKNSVTRSSEGSKNAAASVYVQVKKATSRMQKVVYGFALVVIIFSGFVSVQSFITNNKAQEQIAILGENITRDEQGVTEGSGNEPSEEPIAESVVRNFVPQNPEDPRFLRIPELGVFSRVKTLGLTPEGAVDAPRNIFDTGWYNGSVRPGSRAGSSLILGHVSGWTGPGVFKNISKLSVGAEFEIEKGTGEKIRYSVVRSEQIPLDQVDMSKILSTEVAGEHDVKLMTCSGRYNSATETFEDRFIVYAKQIE
jgi:hypothetical protein